MHSLPRQKMEVRLSLTVTVHVLHPYIQLAELMVFSILERRGLITVFEMNNTYSRMYSSSDFIINLISTYQSFLQTL
jgi:hypothetical protein